MRANQHREETAYDKKCIAIDILLVPRHIKLPNVKTTEFTVNERKSVLYIETNKLQFIIIEIHPNHQLLLAITHYYLVR